MILNQMSVQAVWGIMSIMMLTIGIVPAYLLFGIGKLIKVIKIKYSEKYQIV